MKDPNLAQGLETDLSLKELDSSDVPLDPGVPGVPFRCWFCDGSPYRFERNKPADGGFLYKREDRVWLRADFPPVPQGLGVDHLEGDELLRALGWALPEKVLRPACKEHFERPDRRSRLTRSDWERLSLNRGKNLLWARFSQRTVRKVMES